MTLMPQQRAFFETFGYLALPGLVAEDVPWILEGFEEIFAQRSEKHDGTRRTIAGTDSSERLCALLDHPKVIGVAASLMGDDFNYLGGDANYYVGDSGWHSDGWHDIGLYVKRFTVWYNVGRRKQSWHSLANLPARPRSSPCRSAGSSLPRAA